MCLPIKRVKTYFGGLARPSVLPSICAFMASEKRSSSESGKDAKFAPGAETSSIHEGKFHDEAFIEGSEGVTQHDLDTLRHVGDRLPYSAWLVVTVEFAERYVNFYFLLPSVAYSLAPDGRITARPISSTTTFVHRSPSFQRRVLLSSIALTASLEHLVKANRPLLPSGLCVLRLSFSFPLDLRINNLLPVQ